MKPTFTARNLVVMVTVLPIRIPILAFLLFVKWLGDLAEMAARWVSVKLPGLEVAEEEGDREKRMKRIAGLRKTSQERLN